MFDSEINSGFTTGGDINISNLFVEITLLHKSGNGYSEVYKAKRYGQWHVLKCLTEKATQDVQYQTLLEKEFRIAYPLTHPNIVRTFGMEDVPGLGKCIIQEYIEGEQISAITREQAAELCDAIQYIHNAGIIHRDIKPSNILVRKDNGRVVLIDFGLADKADFTILKGGAGTTGYAAPEQWEGESSPLADIYGLGGVLMLNKKFRRIAAKCRRSNAAQRYASAQAIKKALLRRFPWGWFFAILMFILMIGSSYAGYHFYAKDKTMHNTRIKELYIENRQLEEKVDPIDYEYQIYKNQAEKNARKSAEEIHSLQQDLEREHNANIRLQFESHPFSTSPGGYPTAEDQRY